MRKPRKFAWVFDLSGMHQLACSWQSTPRRWPCGRPDPTWSPVWPFSRAPAARAPSCMLVWRLWPSSLAQQDRKPKKICQVSSLHEELVDGSRQLRRAGRGGGSAARGENTGAAGASPASRCDGSEWSAPARTAAATRGAWRAGWERTGTNGCRRRRCRPGRTRCLHPSRCAPSPHVSTRMNQSPLARSPTRLLATRVPRSALGRDTYTDRRRAIAQRAGGHAGSPVRAGDGSSVC